MIFSPVATRWGHGVDRAFLWMFIRGLELGLLTDGNHQFPKPAPDEQP
jgi:hypothetical protein